jgi:membrane glycosyltransferase
MATTKPIRAVEILIATAVAGLVVKEGAVLLVPEDISEDNARALMRMQRKRAKEAEGDKLKERLAALKAADAR